MAPVPASLLRALSISDPSKASLSTAGLGSGFTSTGDIRATVPSADGQYEEERRYFVKTSADGKAAEEMFRGEYESLNAIATSVPGFCPRALAWGPLEESNGKSFYLATEFLDLGGGGRTGQSLAQRLGKLHSTPAPLDPETEKRRFGFPVPTFCGDTKQPNRFHDSWADFYANERLMAILETSEKRNGRDASLRDLVERTAHTVVPALLRDDHLGYDQNGNGEGITPVIVHGDLWSGNADRGRIVGSGRKGDEEAGDVVYDPSACYAHSEYELGIMKMFGGFGSTFFTAYHKIVPRTEPVEEYEDRNFNMAPLPDAAVHPEATGAAKVLVENHRAEQPLKLYAGWFCPFVQRVWLALEEKQIPYQYIEVNPYHKPQSLLSLNPRGLVPTLSCLVKDGGVQTAKPLYESTVILEYLEEAYPDNSPRLLPEDPYDRARVRIWIDYVTSRIIPAFHRFLQYQPKSGGEDPTADLERLRQEFLGHLKEWTREMHVDGPFFLGDQITLPDLVLAPWAVRLWVFDEYKSGGLGIPAEGNGGEDELVWQRWRKWLKAVEDRRSVRETTSEKGYYLPVYKRYADNVAQSELAKATREGRGVP
ncbi:Fructosamine kinase [Aspergillus parasiticus SU-1]|uniref:protein-ribulosamine 3-kinase n=1 Tax=Aspergillus parasiticus (strain ATCC 56775 / NRRL 5862 / SRRC 143 / SU-1) TaxID=1403190 RepID=A0A0F0IIC2_ASPPU|nr:Fructosamine kinase [Aspergillus parasiticus SU-1]